MTSLRHELSLETIQKLAPSVFATEPYHETSDRYRFVPTIEAVHALRKQGFYPVAAGQSFTRIPDKKNYVKHILRFRHQDMEQGLNVGDEIVEVILQNGHDGSTPYIFSSGIYRKICGNGLHVQSALLASVSVYHRGPEKLLEDVIEASYTVVKDAPKVIEQITEWKGIQLDRPEQEAFAKEAFKLRESTIDVSATELLGINRQADKGDDLWRTMNRVQENIVRGKARGINTENQVRKLRALTSISADADFNRGIWSLTERAAKVKNIGGNVGIDLELVH